MPNNQALASDLSAPQYGYDSSGRLQIEPKAKDEGSWRALS